MSEDQVTEAWMWVVALGLEARTFALDSASHALEIKQKMTTLVFTEWDGFERWLDEEVRA